MRDAVPVEVVTRDPPAGPPGRGRFARGLGALWRYLFVIVAGLLLSGLAHLNADGVIRADWRLATNLPLGVLAIVALRWRHRAPLTVTVLTSVAGIVSALAFGAWVLAVGSMATRRRWTDALVTLVLSVGTSMASGRVYPEDEPGVWWVMPLIALLSTVAILSVGWYVGARRDLIASYRERAEAAEHAQAFREAQARTQERAAIAREMHDVLAHRISLLAMHAGALSYRADLGTEQVREVAGLIQQTAHQALEELRGVLGTLRQGDPRGVGQDGRAGENAPAPPQPTLADLPALLAETADGPWGEGRVTLRDELPAGRPVPDRLGRHLYRIVQETLTNARKHAPYAPVEVVLRGAPGARLGVEVSNPMPSYVGLVAGAERVPGAGLGLIGLAERASLAGGGLTHGSTDDGRYVVRAWMPWPAGDES